MHFQNPEILAGIQRILGALVYDVGFHEDLMQEAIIHLWQNGAQSERRTTSWHLQRCRFLFLDRLKMGTSLDAPTRRGNCVPLLQDDDELLNHPHLQTAHVFEEVSARDIFNVLWQKLSVTDRTILELLAEGLNDSDIADVLDLDRSTATKRRRRIAALAVSLKLSI